MRIRASKGFILAQRVYHRLRAMFLYEMWFPTYSDKIQAKVRWSPDPVRYASMALALERVRIEGIPGAIAEVGVYRGDTSRFLHEQARRESSISSIPSLVFRTETEIIDFATRASESLNPSSEI